MTATTATFGNGDGFRIFSINDGDAANLIDVTLSGLTLTGGDAANGSTGSGQSGGAIFSREDLTVIDSTIVRNSAGDGGLSFGIGGFTPRDGRDGGKGGGIYSSGTVSLITSTVRDNQSGDGRDGIAATSVVGVIQSGYGGQGGSGGGIYSAGPITIDRSTVFRNSTGTGGMDDNADGSVSAADGGLGGGIFNSGTLTMTGSTVSGNETQGLNAHGGGIAAEAADDHCTQHGD